MGPVGELPNCSADGGWCACWRFRSFAEREIEQCFVDFACWAETLVGLKRANCCAGLRAVASVGCAEVISGCGERYLQLHRRVAGGSFAKWKWGWQRCWRNGRGFNCWWSRRR